MNHSYTKLFVHLVWATKNRIPYLTPEIIEELYPFIKSIASQNNVYIISIGGICDHIHILIQIDTGKAISDFVRKVKSISTAFISKINNNEHFAWQNGFSAFSVSYSTVNRIIKYIERQEEHHVVKEFEMENELCFLSKS